MPHTGVRLMGSKLLLRFLFPLLLLCLPFLLLILFWQPWFASPSYVGPPEAQVICVALGQVFIGLYTILLGAFFVALQINSQRIDDLDKKIEEFDELSRHKGPSIEEWLSLNKDLLNLEEIDKVARIESSFSLRKASNNVIRKAPEYSSKPITLNDAGTALISESPFDVETAVAELRGKMERAGRDSARLKQLLDAITLSAYKQKTEIYRESKAHLHSLESQFRRGFVSVSIACFAFMIASFWPDVLLYKIIPKPVPESIPSGVIVCFTVANLMAIASTAVLFLSWFRRILYYRASLEGGK
jgi:hypothetical protein